MKPYNVVFIAFAATLFAEATGEKICSVDNPKSNQVCVSIKFPWATDPVFFCTEHGKINYTPQCTDPTQTNHCYDDGRNDTLKIATPWDCCPMISTPNHCANIQCPAAPFNRTCKEIKILGTCCPTYYCDEGEPDNCKSSRLRASCLVPPPHKKNCTAFRDPFGCCNKYQCKEDEKAGSCPRLGQHHHHPHHYPHHHPHHQPHHHPHHLPHHHPHHHHHHGHHVAEQVQSGQSPPRTPDDSGIHRDHPRRSNHGYGEETVMKRLTNSIATEAKKTVQRVARGWKHALETQGGPVGRAISRFIPDWMVQDTTPAAVPMVRVRPAVPHVPAVATYRALPTHRWSASAWGTIGGGFVGVGMYPNPPIMLLNPSKLIRCAGDHTCPGIMKCCSGISLYAAQYQRAAVREHSANPHTFQNPFVNIIHLNNGNLPVDGFCVEPESQTTVSPNANTASESLPSAPVDLPVVPPPSAPETREPAEIRTGAERVENRNSITLKGADGSVPEIHKKESRAEAEDSDNGDVYVRT